MQGKLWHSFKPTTDIIHRIVVSGRWNQNIVLTFVDFRSPIPVLAFQILDPHEALILRLRIIHACQYALFAPVARSHDVSVVRCPVRVYLEGIWV